jgi:hypothetical protein
VKVAKIAAPVIALTHVRVIDDVRQNVLTAMADR